MKLSELNPETVAETACRALVDHLHSLSLSLGPSVQLRLEGLPDDNGARGSDLGLTVQTLVRVAQGGLPQWDWTDYGMVADGMLSVFSALYSTAATSMQGVESPELADEIDPSDALGTVLLACHARVLLAKRDEGGHAAPVEPKHLAVLAGITTDAVQLLIRNGEIKATDTKPKKIRPKDAIRWLESRGVRSFSHQDGFVRPASLGARALGGNWVGPGPEPAPVRGLPKS